MLLGILRSWRGSRRLWLLGSASLPRLTPPLPLARLRTLSLTTSAMTLGRDPINFFTRETLENKKSHPHLHAHPSHEPKQEQKDDGLQPCLNPFRPCDASHKGLVLLTLFPE